MITIVPQWYLLSFYAILRSIPNKLLGVISTKKKKKKLNKNKKKKLNNKKKNIEFVTSIDGAESAIALGILVAFNGLRGS
jgi:quinol-cytochrome oxidoreductase complex cytochrome b subunit